MTLLPLFPLNTVLFPGVPLSLHIFEPRYKKMIDYCLEQDVAFGVVLIQRGKEALDSLAEPYEVGCTARITNTNQLTMGRKNLLTIGEERFKITSTDTSKEYLQAQVEFLPRLSAHLPVLEPGSKRLHKYMGAYIKLLVKAEMIQTQIYSLPDDPIELAYLSAHLLQISARHKQPLLEIDSAEELLEACVDSYRRELSLMKSLVNTSRSDRETGRLN